MKQNLRQIGNSKGIILPASFLKELQINDNSELEMEIEENKIIISKIEEPRKGWLEACEKMHKNGDDRLIIPDVFEDENMEDWKW